VPNRPLESVHRLGLAFRRNLDPSVRQVADPPFYPLTACGRFREVPEPDALHSTADEISSRDPHITLRIADCGLRIDASGIPGLLIDAEAFRQAPAHQAAILTPQISIPHSATFRIPQSAIRIGKGRYDSMRDSR
jgi:hypothetical protein